MRKHSIKITFWLAVGLVMLFITPKPAQQLFRNQFLKPFIPFAQLVPFRGKYASKPTQSYLSLSHNIEPSFQGQLARILYRNPKTWNDYFWINLGKKHNTPDLTKIALQSPVLYNGCLIGLVDYVGEKQSRVQLITNSRLSLSVRALRGQAQYDYLAEKIDSLLDQPLIQQEKSLVDELSKMKEKVKNAPESAYLAKGELFGVSDPLWRSHKNALKGRGFQCEFKDALSAQRDLKTGVKKGDALGIELPIIQTGDLLVTTGFDGIIPANVKVASVSKVEKLVEGAYAYSLEAIPLAPELKDLNWVEVILPCDYKKLRPSLPAFEEN